MFASPPLTPTMAKAGDDVSDDPHWGYDTSTPVVLDPPPPPWPEAEATVGIAMLTTSTLVTSVRAVVFRRLRWASFAMVTFHQLSENKKW